MGYEKMPRGEGFFQKNQIPPSFSLPFFSRSLPNKTRQITPYSVSTNLEAITRRKENGTYAFNPLFVINARKAHLKRSIIPTLKER
jgi:hypothetical protein